MLVLSLRVKKVLCVRHRCVAAFISQCCHFTHWFDDVYCLLKGSSFVLILIYNSMVGCISYIPVQIACINGGIVSFPLTLSGYLPFRWGPCVTLFIVLCRWLWRTMAVWSLGPALYVRVCVCESASLRWECCPPMSREVMWSMCDWRGFPPLRVGASGREAYIVYMLVSACVQLVEFYNQAS